MSEAIGAHVERVRAEGVVPSISPVSLRYIVLGAAGLIFSQAPECKYIAGIDPTDREFAERHADALVQLLTGRTKRSRSVQSRRRRSS